MSLATREQKAVMTDFAGDGPFGPFGRQKDMKERLEENASEQLRLRTAVYFMIISLSGIVLYMMPRILLPPRVFHWLQGCRRSLRPRGQGQSGSRRT